MLDLKRRFFTLFVLIVMAWPLISQEDKPLDVMPDPAATRVFYSVFVQSFYDSNGDGIGDIPGLISKLDYLQDLGVGGLWLLPVHPSPTYHKYDVADYYDIHPDYGTLDDYKKLVSEAHKRNMVVLLDLVVNHTSNLHPWFKDASSNRKAKYRNYYVWTDDSKTIEADKYHWHQVRNEKGEKQKGENYYGFFWWEMPDLNYDEPAVRSDIKEMAKFWLREVQVDGFRLDAARYIYPLESESSTIAWWTEFSNELKKTNKKSWVLGELWGGSSEVAPYLKGAVSAGFNFELADTIRKSVQQGYDAGILATWIKINHLFAKIKPTYEDAIFLSNHDQNRIMSEVGGHQGKATVAASLLLTLPGNPFIYYGEEIGMLGEKPDEYIREPFLWNIENQDPGQTTWEIPWKSSSKTVKPLFFQQDDPQSLYNHYRSLIKLRNNSRALSQGWTNTVETGNKKVVGFIRETNGERVLVLINLGGEMEKISLSENFRTQKVLYSTHPVFKRSAGTVYLQEYSAFVVELR